MQNTPQDAAARELADAARDALIEIRAQMNASNATRETSAVARRLERALARFEAPDAVPGITRWSEAERRFVPVVREGA